MTKAETTRRERTTRILKRIVEIVANNPGISINITGTEKIGITDGLSNIKYITVRIKGEKVLTAAYVIGRESDSLREMEIRLKEIVEGWKDQKNSTATFAEN